MNRVQKELNLIDAEETKDLVSKLCGKLLVGWVPLVAFVRCTS